MARTPQRRARTIRTYLRNWSGGSCDDSPVMTTTWILSGGRRVGSSSEYLLGAAVEGHCVRILPLGGRRTCILRPEVRTPPRMTRRAGPRGCPWIVEHALL